MKKTLRLMAVAAILLPVLAGCSDKKSGNDNADATEQTSPQTEAEEAEAANFDIEGLNALTRKNELESDDIDFVLDQAEILARSAKGMNRSEYNAYLNTLEKQERDAVFIIALGLEGIKNSKELSGKQKERMEDIESRIPMK
ncbi:MAG: hypothetical protein IJY00_05970 [Bacteroidaceae bacterium]|nr:hypothetical protein [Bacteroidaceae bacterium]